MHIEYDMQQDSITYSSNRSAYHCMSRNLAYSRLMFLFLLHLYSSLPPPFWTKKEKKSKTKTNSDRDILHAIEKKKKKVSK